jgi:hypothetical protein
MLAVLLVGRVADEVGPRRRRRRLGWLVPHLRRPLLVWTSLVAGLVVGSIAGVFAGSVIVNAVKPPRQPPPVPEPWVPPGEERTVHPPSKRAPGRPPGLGSSRACPLRLQGAA